MHFVKKRFLCPALLGQRNLFSCGLFVFDTYWRQQFRMAAEPAGEFPPAVPFGAERFPCGKFGFFRIGVEGLEKIVVEISDFGCCQPMMRRYNASDSFCQWGEQGKVFVSFRGD